MSAAPKRSAAWVAAALFAWFAVSAWIRPFALPDEGRYVGVAWEMLRTGNWSVPTLDGMPFFHKPVLFYWLSAAAMQVFGDNEWAARVPSLLGATLAAFGLYLFVRRWVGERQARWSAAVLATLPFFCMGAQFANLDMLVAGCISATILLGAHAMMLADEGRPYRAPLVGAYAMAGLGLLAKGLIGGVLPAGTFIVWLLVARRPGLILKMLSLPGLLAFLVVGMPWFVAMQLRYPGFFDYFVIYHHFKRFAASGFNNPQPWYFYPAAIALLSIPSSFALPWVFKRRDGDGGRLSVSTLMWCWLVVVVGFFSLPKSKLIGYVLPALPPFGWLLSRVLSEHKRLAIASMAAGGVISVGVAIGVAIYHPHSTRAMGEVLRAQRQPGEPVVFANDRYPYDLPFYARMSDAPQVLGDWQGAEIVKHDDWRKELYDAGLFEPKVAAHQLIHRDGFAALRCASPAVWLVAKEKQVAADPLMRGATRMAENEDGALWRLPRDAASCGGTPSAGSAGK